MLITQDTTVPLSNETVAYFSCPPTGPFVARTLVYTTPETGASGSYGNPNVLTYNLHAHPELSSDDQMVTSYNVSTFDNEGDLFDGVTIYRPRFVGAVLSIHIADSRAVGGQDNFDI